MKNFKYLQSLLPHVSDAFSKFYDEMLSDERFVMFFDNQQQIENLIKKQEKHFANTLEMSYAEIKSFYIFQGESHFDMRIPYIDLQRATEILEEYFLIHIVDEQGLHDSLLTNEILDYFRMMRTYMAKGYLNRMLFEDKNDIEDFVEQISQMGDTYFSKTIILKKINWLRNLINAVENEITWEESKTMLYLQEWFDELRDMSLEKKHFFENIERRIILNTNNLFYFLKRGEYQEILTLYSSLLSLYKLVLMLNNALTIEYADKVIGDMRYDALTGLFRKDIFFDLLTKEMANTNRYPNDYFSVAFIDIDDFKTINDKYGHYSGDKVLETLGEIIRKNIRISDYGIRVGGDEFALLLKHANFEQAIEVCKKILKEINEIKFEFNHSTTFNVTLSIGIEEYSGKNKMDFKEFTNSVDQKLYLSKSLGKNRIS